MAFWDQLKLKAGQFKNKNFAKASMAVWALVAASDGNIEAAERRRCREKTRRRPQDLVRPLHLLELEGSVRPPGDSTCFPLVNGPPRALGSHSVASRSDTGFLSGITERPLFSDRSAVPS